MKGRQLELSGAAEPSACSRFFDWSSEHILSGRADV